MASLRTRLLDVLDTAKSCVMIWTIDLLPNYYRRRLLSSEYKGEELEQRLKLRIGGGYRMIKALWRMTSINRNPPVKLGAAAPHLHVLRLDDDAEAMEEISLLSLATPGRPLVLNFGSCT